jgi:hypothetical protein
MFDDQWVGGARYRELSARERSRGARRHRREERRRRLVGVARRMLVWAAVLGGIAGTDAWAARDDPPGKPATSLLRPCSVRPTVPRRPAAKAIDCFLR